MNKTPKPEVPNGAFWLIYHHPKGKAKCLHCFTADEVKAREQLRLWNEARPEMNASLETSALAEPELNKLFSKYARGTVA